MKFNLKILKVIFIGVNSHDEFLKLIMISINNFMEPISDEFAII